MRLQSHTVVFDNDPAYLRLVSDPSGSVLRILNVWIGDVAGDSTQIHHYLGSVRRCACGGWMSHRELVRLFRRATTTARLVGETGEILRSRLSGFLREYFCEDKCSGD